MCIRDRYYTGDDGVMRTGWQKLYPPDNYEEDSNKVIPGAEGGSVDYGEDGQYWFYFGTSGKKYVPSDGNDNGDYGTRKIDGCLLYTSKGNGYAADVLMGLRWIREHRNEYGIRIVNISVGSLARQEMTENSVLVKGVNAAWDDGCLLYTS